MTPIVSPAKLFQFLNAKFVVTFTPYVGVTVTNLNMHHFSFFMEDIFMSY